MDDFPMNDMDLPSDVGEQSGDVAEIEDYGVDQSLDDAISDVDVDFEDIQTVDDTLVSNFEESDLATSSEVSEYINENIPTDHVSGLDSIEYVNDQQAYENGEMGQWTGNLEPGVNAIEVFPHDDQQEFYDTVAHEIGHNAENTLDHSIIDDWNGLHNQSMENYTVSDGTINEFITPYSMEGADEDFAETYAFYINDPPYLQEVSPDKYDFMADNVFKGQEY